MFLASLGPVLMTPTLLYLAGVPGALKPRSCSNLTSTFGPRAAPAEGASAATASATAATINPSVRAAVVRARMREPPTGSVVVAGLVEEVDDCSSKGGVVGGARVRGSSGTRRAATIAPIE